MAKKALTLHMNEQIIDDFRNYCSLNALKLSAKVELLLKHEMETAHSNPTLVKLFEEIIEKQTLKGASSAPAQEKIQKQKTQEDIQKPQTQEKTKQSTTEPKRVPSIEHLRRVKGI